MGDAKPRRLRCIDSDSDSEAPGETSREGREEDEEEEGMVEAEEFESTEEDEEEEETGAGLAREELQRERLYAGDTIEYYSMAFVFGDPRGHCVAKVLKVMKRETEYPLRLDSQEMLPSTQMIKRKANRRGEELASGAAVWRKIRTFKLIDGREEGPTRAKRLNDGLKQAVIGAFEAVRKEVFNKDTPMPRKESKSSNGAKKSGLISSFFDSQPPAVKASPSKSYKRERPESIASKPLEKRHRIVLTPPATNENERKPPLTVSSKSASRHRDDDKKRHHERSSPKRSGRDRDHHPLKSSPSKFSLLKFVNQIEEEKQDPGIDLNSYLALEEKRKSALSELEEAKQAGQLKTADVPRRMAPLSSSSGVGRMRAAGGGECSQREKKPIKMKAMQNYFKAPPRLHPTASKTTDADKRTASLSFIMDGEPNHSVTKERRVDDEHRRQRESGKPKSPKKSRPQKPEGVKKPLMDTWTTSKKR